MNRNIPLHKGYILCLTRDEKVPPNLFDEIGDGVCAFDRYRDNRGGSYNSSVIEVMKADGSRVTGFWQRWFRVVSTTMNFTDYIFIYGDIAEWKLATI